MSAKSDGKKLSVNDLILAELVDMRETLHAIEDMLALRGMFPRTDPVSPCPDRVLSVEIGGLPQNPPGTPSPIQCNDCCEKGPT